MQRGKLNLSKETLRDLDSFFREQILHTDELTDRERDVVIEYYLRSEQKNKPSNGTFTLRRIYHEQTR